MRRRLRIPAETAILLGISRNPFSRRPDGDGIEKKERVSMRKILVGYDGSNSGKEALHQAAIQAASFSARVVVARSMSSGSPDNAEEIEAAENDLAYAESLFRKQNIPCETHLLIRGLSPGEDLVRYADDNDVDLIVVGVRRRPAWGKCCSAPIAST